MNTDTKRHDQPPAVDAALDDAAEGVHDVADHVAAMVPLVQALIRHMGGAQHGAREALSGVARARECVPRRKVRRRPAAGPDLAEAA